MKRLWTLIAITGLSFTFASPAYAAALYDADLSVSISPTPSTIVAGTEVDVTFTMTNVGTEPVYLRGINYLFYSASLSFTGFSASYPDTQCHPEWTAAEVPAFGTKYKGAICLIDEDNFAPPLVQPGDSETFTFHLLASSAFVNGETKIHGVSLPPKWEEGSWEFVDQVEAVEYIEELENFTSNNVWNYTYEAPAGTPTTKAPVTTGKNSATTGTSSQISRGTAVVEGNTATSTKLFDFLDGDSLISQDESQGDASEKAEVAIDLRNALPDRITREDPTALEALLSGNYKYQTMAALISIALSLGMFYTMRKRYFKKLQIEKEYRKALKAKSVFRSPELQAKHELTSK